MAFTCSECGQVFCSDHVDPADHHCSSFPSLATILNRRDNRGDTENRTVIDRNSSDYNPRVPDETNPVPNSGFDGNETTSSLGQFSWLRNDHRENFSENEFRETENVLKRDSTSEIDRSNLDHFLSRIYDNQATDDQEPLTDPPPANNNCDNRSRLALVSDVFWGHEGMNALINTDAIWNADIRTINRDVLKPLAIAVVLSLILLSANAVVFGSAAHSTGISDSAVLAGVIGNDEGDLAQRPFNDTAIERGIFRKTNLLRKNRSVKELSYSDKLAQAAQAHSRDMAVNDYTGHQYQNGPTIENRYGWFGIHCSRQGELVLYVRFDEVLDSKSIEAISQRVVEGWLTSKSHEAVLVNGSWRTSGIGVSQDFNKGIYVTMTLCG